MDSRLLKERIRYHEVVCVGEFCMLPTFRLEFWHFIRAGLLGSATSTAKFSFPHFHSPMPLDQSGPGPSPDCNLTKATVSWSSPGALHAVLIAVLIAVERGGGLVEEGRRFFPPEIWNHGFASGSTPSGPMVLWMAQAHPAHQIGLPPILQVFLIAVERHCREVGGRSEGIYSARKLD
jgi:hypothetical protein